MSLKHVTTEFHEILDRSDGRIRTTVSKAQDDNVYEIVTRRVNQLGNSSTLKDIQYVSEKKYKDVFEKNTRRCNEVSLH